MLRVEIKCKCAFILTGHNQKPNEVAVFLPDFSRFGYFIGKIFIEIFQTTHCP
jgi:hypothetical protein